MLFNYIQFHVRIAYQNNTYFIIHKRKQLDNEMLKLSQEFM
jgi:hypothetical protein